MVGFPFPFVDPPGIGSGVGVASSLVESELLSSVGVDSSVNVVSGPLVTVTVGGSVIFVVPPAAKSAVEAVLTRYAVVL